MKRMEQNDRMSRNLIELKLLNWSENSLICIKTTYFKR